MNNRKTVSRREMLTAALAETSKAGWAAGMKTLLLEIKSAVDKARESGSKRLPPRRKQRWLKVYDGFMYGTLRRKRVRAKKAQPEESVIKAGARKLACLLARSERRSGSLCTTSQCPYEAVEESGKVNLQLCLLM
jgi:hypothetical protein